MSSLSARLLVAVSVLLLFFFGVTIVVLNTAFDEPTIAVDTHIFRVSNRTGLAPGKTPLQVEQKLLKVVPREFMLDAHHWLILHGRYTCKARKPNCPECIVRDLCSFKNKTVL